MSVEPQPETVILMARQDYEHARQDAVERIKIQAALADRALQALLLANGGALIALFTFVGTLAGAGKKAAIDPGYMKGAFAFFALGLGLALIAHILGFMSQDRFFNQSTVEMWRHQRVALSGVSEERDPAELVYHQDGQRAYLGGVTLAIASVLFFIVGCWSALLGVSV